jgi:hypothetical protein
LPKDAQLDGFDISFDAAPPVQVLPPNVNFHHWDVHEDIPRGFVGTFDVVHIRFFSFVVLNEEVPNFVSKLYSLLSKNNAFSENEAVTKGWIKEPGGYVQWDEVDLETIRFDKAKPDSTTDSLVEMFRLLTVQDPRLKPTWARDLNQHMSQAGFIDVDRDTRDAPPHLAFQFHECGLMIHELIARKTANESMANELKRLLPAAVEETRNGAYVTGLRFSVIGQKPRGELG